MHALQKALNDCKTIDDVLAVFESKSNDEINEFAQHGWQAVSLDGATEPELFGERKECILAYTRTHVVWDDFHATGNRIAVSDIPS